MTKASELAITLTTRLSEITIANGYNTDIGARVFRGKRSIGEGAVPCVIIVEGDDTPTSDALRNVAIDQAYSIEAHDACDPNNPNDKAHLILVDIKRAIFGKDQNLDGLARKLEYKGRSILPREDGLAIVTAGISINVRYVDDLTNP